MARQRKDREDDEPEHFWRDLAKDAIIAGVIVAVFLGGLYVYAGVWPPLVVVESSSMSHSDAESKLGVIDTGDMVFQQSVSGRSAVVTYIEGRVTGYATYGDYGDVIIFRRATSATPIIHRAIMYIELHPNGTANVPDLASLPATEWTGRNGTGSTQVPENLKSVTIHHMGFEQNINMTFSFDVPSPTQRSGFVTMGAHNSSTIPPRTTGCPLKEGCLDLEAVASGFSEDLILLEDFLHVEQGHGRLDLLRPAAAAEGPDPSVHEAEHVQLGDEVRHAALGQRDDPRLAAQLAVRCVDLARGELRVPDLLVEQDAEQDDLRLRRQALDRLNHGVQLDLVLRPLDVLLRDVLVALSLRQLRADSEQVEGPPCIAVLLRGEGRDEMQDGVLRGPVLEREAGALRQDVEQFLRVVGREDHLFVREAGPDARVEVLRELEVVRDPDQGHARLRQIVVDLQELIEDVVAVLLDDLVDFIEGDDHDALLLVELLPQEVVDPVRGQPGEGDPLVEILHQLVADRLEDAVGRVDDFAVEVEVLDHPRAVRLAELVLDLLDDGGLPGPGLPEDQHVARPLALQGGHQDLRELVDVALAVRQVLRDVRRPQYLPVHLEDRSSS